MLMCGFGCMNPMSTRYPSVIPRAAETERRAAQIKDPYPDARMGPDVGFRPTEFQTQRSVPLNAKDRFYSGFASQPRYIQQPPPGAGMPPGAASPNPQPAF